MPFKIPLRLLLILEDVITSLRGSMHFRGSMVALAVACSTDICSFIQQALIEGLLYVRFCPCDVGDTVMTDSLGPAFLELTVQSGQGWGIGTRESGV